nr:MAG TPA: hypothetical protein [Caudoviricetes sp.]
MPPKILLATPSPAPINDPNIKIYFKRLNCSKDNYTLLYKHLIH